jgi:cytochrome c oxidase cbb3-type subunit 4
MIDILRQIAVVLGALAFLGVCWWAFSPKRKKRFEEDAKLPFADEEPSAREGEEPSAGEDEKPSAQEGKEPSVREDEGQSGESAENAGRKEFDRQDKQ